MKFLGSLALTLASVTLLFADPPTVPRSPTKMKVGDTAEVVVKAQDADSEFNAVPGWADPKDCVWFEGARRRDGSQKFLVIPKKAGKYKVVFWSVGDYWGDYSEHVIEVEGPSPAPTPPPPNPDDPPPGPAPNPNGPKSDKFRVLILYDLASITSMPASQQDILASTILRKELFDLGVAEFSFITPDQEFGLNASPVFKDWKGRKRESLPWMIAAGGKGNPYEGKLPANAETLKTILRSVK